ncbi:MAG: helix-turn-helix transcriptional regulator [Armatimonadetes bacterium]|nr:helix-turn-helix transcriptional regulator [Armatimonadota bacterium]
MISKRLGRRIATLRRAARLSQEELAERAGYSVGFISLVERGVNAPSIGGADRIARALGRDIRDLFDFSEEAE